MIIIEEKVGNSFACQMSSLDRIYRQDMAHTRYFAINSYFLHEYK